MKNQANSAAKEKKTFRQIMCTDNAVGYVFAAPFIVGFCGLTLFPMLLSLYYSMTNYNFVNSDFIGLANYTRMFLQDSKFWYSVWRTLIYVVLAVPAKLIFALLVAYFLTRETKIASLYRAVYYLPSLVGGSVAVALVWKQMFARKGMINSILKFIGIGRLNWMGDKALVMFPLALLTVWQFGSSMIIFAAGLKEIPSTYYEAAEIDGANAFQRFIKITLPCLSPVILYNLVMQTITGFMVFTQAFIITQGGPADATNFIAYYIYNQGFKYQDMGYASALSWVLLIVISAVTLVIFKTSKKWVFYEAGSDD